MMLHPAVFDLVERRLAGEVFGKVALEALAQEYIGEPALIVRAMLRAAYGLAFERLEHDEAVRCLAAALAELNAEHARKA